MNNLRQQFIISALTLITLLCNSTLSLAEENNILVIASAHKDFLWQKRFDAGFSNRLHSMDESAKIYFEYIHSGKEVINQQLFAESIIGKYSDKKINYLISESIIAKKFLVSYPELLPQAKRIYVNPGVKDGSFIDPSRDDMALLIHNNFYEAIYELLTLISPENVYVITDTFVAAREDRLALFKEDANKISSEHGVKFTYWVNHTVEQLVKQVRELPENSAIFYLLIFEDGTGNNYTPFDVAEQIAANASVPVFSRWDSLIGSGIVGGYLTSPEHIGEMAASYTLELLPKGDNRAFQISGSRHIYDARALDKWGIDVSKLPADAIILFQDSMWPYKTILLISLVLVLILIITLVMVFKKNR